MRQKCVHRHIFREHVPGHQWDCRPETHGVGGTTKAEGNEAGLNGYRGPTSADDPNCDAVGRGWTENRDGISAGIFGLAGKTNFQGNAAVAGCVVEPSKDERSPEVVGTGGVTGPDGISSRVYGIRGESIFGGNADGVSGASAISSSEMSLK